MKKVKVTLPTSGWGSLNTKYRPYGLQVGDNELTAGSTSVVSSANGSLSKRLGGIDYNASALSAAIEDQHEAVFSDGSRYLLAMAGGTLSSSTGGGTFTTVAAGYTAAGNMEFATYNDRVYFGNGIDTPQCADRTTAYGGRTYIPVTFTVSSFAGLAGDSVTIGSTTFTEGVEWTAATDNPTTAESLRAAIDAHADYIATRSGSVVTVRPLKYAVKASTTDATNLAMAAVVGLRVKDMGAQVPSSALTSAVGAGGNVVAGSYFYKVTYLYFDAEESNGSAASTVVSPGVSSQITLTAIPTGGYGVTARKIYRSGDAGATYRLVATLSDNTTTSTSDNTATGTTLIPTVNGLPPVFGLIIQLKDRLWLGQVSGERSKLYRTEAALPNIVRPTNFTLCDSRDPITGLFPFNGRPIVFNRASFGQILGDTSDAYRYDRVSGPVGCVDNRSIQERTIRGVPVLVWLADKNLYQWNGATVDVISDKIEDIVQVNLQQAQQVKGSHTDTLQADFTAGTASGGITLTATPGSVTTPNPTRLWQTEADWEGGVLTNIVSNDVSNVIKVPVKFAPAFDDGTLGGSAETSGLNLTLPANAGNTGVTWAASSDVSITNPGVGTCGAFAQQITLARAGTLTALAFRFNVIDFGAAGDGQFVFSVWSNSIGAPNTVLGSSSSFTVPSSPNAIANRSSGAMSVALAAGTYWVGVRGLTTDIAFSQVGGSADISGAKGVTGRGVNTPWGALSPATGLSGSYTFVQTAVPASGSYTSETYDTQSGNIDGTLTLTHAATYPATTGSTTMLDASTNGSTWVNVLSTADQNGAQTVALSAASLYRYFRVRMFPTTTDDRNVPILEPATLKFATTAVWVSEEIDCTADVTVYEALTAATTIPAGTSVTVEAASSLTSGAGYGAYGAIGSTTVRRYLKARLTITADTADELTAVVSSLRFNYRIVANFVSAAIDTDTTPAGWDVFQAVTASNGGTLLLEMRTAASSGTLGAASYATVTNGAFPSNAALQFVQWRATFTSTADAVPTLASVTINWFISSVDSIRAASLFFNKSYYLSVAEFGETENNLIIELDGDNKWRVHEGVAAATLGLFFNDPYYGSAEEGVFVRWLTGSTERGDNIAMVVRTKAFDFGDLTKRKVQGNFTVSGKRTGATFACRYSPDAGVTFYPFVDSTGSTTFTIAESTDPTPFIRRLRPRSADVYNGATFMYEVATSDAHAAEVNELRTEVLVREGAIVDV